MAAPAQRWIAEQFAFLVVVAVLVVAFAFLLISPADWRPATFGMAAGVLLAALLRLALPPARAGMLVVRSRTVDVLCYLLLGGVIVAVDLRLHG